MRKKILLYSFIGCLLGFFHMMFPLPAFAVSTCGFQTTPSGPFVNGINDFTYSFNTNEIFNEINQQDLPLNGTLSWYYPDNKAVLGVGGCNWGTTIKQNLQSITDIPNPLQRNAASCKSLLTTTTQPRRIQIWYKNSKLGDTLLCDASFEIQTAKSTCTLNISLKTGSGDVDSTWNVSMNDIFFDKKYNGYAIRINGAVQFSDFLSGNTQASTIIGPNLDSGQPVIELMPAVLINEQYNMHSIKEVGPVCDSKQINITKRGTIDLCADKSARDEKLCTPPYDICNWCLNPPTPTPAAICSAPMCQGSCAGPCNVCCATVPPRPTRATIPKLKPICDQIADSQHPEFQANCIKCTEDKGVYTALGCFSTDYQTFISEDLFPIGLGIGGGLAFIYFIYGAFLVLTSMGNPEQIAQGQETITAAISGLLLIIFSVFILRIIGVDILKLPGFS